MEKECQKKRYVFLPYCDAGGYFMIKSECPVHVNVVLTTFLQNEAASRRVSDLEAVVKCIEDRNISLVKLKDLKNQIASQEKEMASRKLDSPIGCNNHLILQLLLYRPLPPKLHPTTECSRMSVSEKDKFVQWNRSISIT
ncbi:hypothetical protein REPUB_Repub16aG0092600 [Reevesia pubescens]